MTMETILLMETILFKRGGGEFVFTVKDKSMPMENGALRRSSVYSPNSSTFKLENETNRSFNTYILLHFSRTKSIILILLLSLWQEG